MTTARQFFETVREASKDAERCRTQLLRLEGRARSLGGGGFEPRTRSTPDPQRAQRRMDAYMDQERRLERRMDEDYDVIGRSDVVLYGDAGRPGLDRVQSPVWADVLWWRYLDDATWDAVADAVGYSPRTCQEMCDQALAWIDRVRFMSTVIDSVN